MESTSNWHSAENRFESMVCRELDRVEIVAGHANRLPHTSNLAFLGMDRQALMMALDLAA